MAANNYEKSLQMILHHEGGYVNHPKDPGGMTNMGVTKRVYEEWVGHTVSEHTMQNLKESDVAPIYRKNYWDRMRCDDLPEGLDLMLFDFGVNAGTGRAAKMLQKMIGTTVDGGIGPNTLKKLDEYISKQHSGVGTAISEYAHRRQSYYESLATFATFGRGWTRRTTETTAEALKLHNSA